MTICDIPGFCKAATLDDIRQHNHILTPGRYVGAAEVEDDGEPFEEKMARLTDGTARADGARPPSSMSSSGPTWRRSGMAGEWPELEWGEIATLEYGKSLVTITREPVNIVYTARTDQSAGTMSRCANIQASLWGDKCAYRGIDYSAEPFFVIDTAFYLKPKEKMDLRWAYYCLLTYDINGMDSGSAIPSTSRESFYRLPVHIPPLKEQQAIACILGALDDKIELNRRKNRTPEAMARAIFKSWFVDFDPFAPRSMVATARSCQSPYRRFVSDLLTSQRIARFRTDG